MEIILLKRDVLFMFVQVSVFWNFCNGYIQLCQDSNIWSHNGTTVTAEIGKPASVLFCVTSDRILHIDVLVNQPSHRRGWIRIIEKPDKFISKFNITNAINITIDNVQRNDFNVSFSVKVYTQLNGNVDHNDFLILAFILQQQMTTTTMATTSSITAITKPTEGTVTVISGSTRSRAMISENTTSGAMITSTSVTEPASQCQPQAASRYPEEWLFVGSKYMVLLPDIFPRSSKCPDHVGAVFPDRTDISFLRPCFTYLLLNSSVKTIRIQNNEYFNVANNAVESERVPYHYRVVCLVPQEKFVPIKITEFTLEVLTSGTRKLHRDLLPEEDSLHVTIHPTEDTLTLTCVGNGKPEPEVQILHGNIILTRNQGRANHMIYQAGCRNSSVYSCHVKNSFMSSHVQRRIKVRNRMKIQSFTITYTNLSIVGDVEMRCSVTSCSSPYVLTLTDDTNHTIAGPTDSALIHKITSVQCSDMGTYFCRGETPDGHIEEEREDLRVYRCPVQVCRGDDESKVVSSVVGQRLNISVCIMSYPNPWRSRGQNKDVSVHFTRRSQHSGIYYTAHIIFHNVTERHHGNHIIMMENGYGSLNYTVTIILLTTTTTITTTATSANKTVPATTSQILPAQESPAHNTSDKDSKIRDIGLTAGIVLFATAFIAFLIHCYRMKLLRRSRELVIESKPEGRSGQNEIALLPLSKDQTELISGSGYENISREEPTCPVDLNSPYSHYEEIRNVETGSRERSSAPTKRESSDVQRDQVEYEIPVVEKPKDDNPTPYVQLDDHQPGAPATPISSASKEISQFSNVVEYENTLPAL